MKLKYQSIQLSAQVFETSSKEVFMLLRKAVVKTVQSELKFNLFHTLSQNSPMLDLINTELSVLDLNNKLQLKSRALRAVSYK
jgi:hypothetical protein